MKSKYDFIVVGAGSSGCALAARLSEDPTVSVLLLEAGPTDWNPILKIPLASGKALRDGLYGWNIDAEPQPETGGRRIPLPRGRVLGGSSSINGMVYIRGNAADYDEWAALGNDGWGYQDVLPAFRKSECHAERSGAYHGSTGPLGVTTARGNSPVFEAFIEAALQAGFPRNEDFNGPTQEGFGFFDFTIWNGRRASSSVSFLQPAVDRVNLTIRTGATAVRVLMKGKRAIGVELAAGKTQTKVFADEVCLCAGSLKTPQLLMLSGIGEPQQLERLGLPVLLDLKGVGKNLQDHLHVPLQFGCPLPVTTHTMIRADRIALSMLQAMFLNSGPATSFPTQAGGFTRSNSALGAPDLQYHLINALGISRIRFPGRQAQPLERDGFTLSVCLLRPKSSGEVSIRSANPMDRPIVHLNWLTEHTDVDILLAGIEQAMEIARQPALRPYISDWLNQPGPKADRSELARWARSMCGSVHHQVGTCRMGTDSSAVVDSRLRVHGMQGLRIVDASIMPSIVRGNTNAAAIMIAERAADFILPPSTSSATRAVTAMSKANTDLVHS